MEPKYNLLPLIIIVAGAVVFYIKCGFDEAKKMNERNNNRDKYDYTDEDDENFIF